MNSGYWFEQVYQNNDVDDAPQTIGETARRFVDSGDYLTYITGVQQKTPWTSASLDSCERAMLERAEELTEEDKRRYMLFLGEGLCRRFGGEWSDGIWRRPDTDDYIQLYGIYYPRLKHYDAVSHIVDDALAEKSGQCWSAFFLSTDLVLEEIEEELSYEDE